MADRIWTVERTGVSPIVAVAIHDGHSLREELAALCAVSESHRRREEDSHTSRWTQVAATRIVGVRSRFEVDLNRPRHSAVYAGPEDAWGIQAWREHLGEPVLARSLAEYDAFYEDVENILRGIANMFGHFVVLDLHSYNHRRTGPNGPPADPAENPEVNVGTGTMDARWGPLADRFMSELRSFDFLGRHLDVRENVKFRGGHLSRWIHETFPDSGCALAVEFKKFFMDEWTGDSDEEQIDAIQKALRSTVPGLLAELERS